MKSSPRYRRKEDSNLVIRFWRIINPYFHIASFLIVSTFVITLKYSQVDAYGGRLSSLEVFKDAYTAKLDRMDQKLDDMIDFWNVPHKEPYDKTP